ncbi:MAG TPA: hypothetical protein VKD08_12540 [Ignavibacteriaceae bacterium]|jgi:hypothetical protein|nr:hypothetical protein [Ignavibacteriaceae bacterium]
MKERIILIIAGLFLFLFHACSQIDKEQTDTEKLMGRWKAAETTSFKGKEIEFLPDHQVKLILENGGEPMGQYEIKENTIIFSIGDAPPFTMNYRIEDKYLYLSSPGEEAETKYLKIND